MAVFNVIKLSELEGEKRLDAEYYKPELRFITEILKKREIIEIGKVADVVDGPFGSSLHAENYVEKGIPFLRVHNVTKEGLLNLSDLVFIREEDHERLKSSEALPGDVIITKTGWVGFATVITDDIKKCNYRADLAKIRLRTTTRLDPYFVSMFLNSKYGRLQTKRLMSGARGDRILATNIKKIVIPYLNDKFQKEIMHIYTLAIEQYKTSITLYSQAESLLLEELGLKDFKPKYEKTYTAKLSYAFSAHRIDAEYFQPAYEEVIEKLRENNIELQPLRKFILSIQKGIEPGSEKYQDEGKSFIRVSNLSKYGFTDRDQKYLSEELYMQLRETYEPKQGDFLLTKDATPGIAYVVKEQIEGIISSGILRLQINENEIDKEYLALCINSIIGKMQVERDCGGSVILHWKPEQVKRLQIPLLSFSIQQEIASLVQQSHEARKEAKELLEVAKKAVEIAIEEGEEKAKIYLLNHRIKNEFI
jgi:type I restriction enzyme S subunit